MNSRRSGRRVSPVLIVGLLMFGIALVIMLSRRGGMETVPLPVEENSAEVFTRRIQRQLAEEPVSAAPLAAPVRLSAANVTIRERGGGAVFAARSIVGSVAPNAFFRGGTLVHSARIRGLQADLVRRAVGVWNYEQPLADLLREEPDGTEKRRIDLRAMTVESGTVRLTMDGTRYSFERVETFSPLIALDPAQPGPIVNLSRVRTVAVMDSATRIPLDARNVRIAVGDAIVGFDIARVTSGQTVGSDISGSWALEQGPMGIAASGRVEGLRFADLRWISPALPDTGRASFTFRTERLPGGRLRVALSGLRAQSEGSEVAGSLVAIVGGPGRPEIGTIDLQLNPLQLALLRSFVDSLPYGGTISGRVRGTGSDLRFDLTGDLTAPGVTTPFRTTLAGRAALAATGVRLRELTTEVHDLPLRALSSFFPGLPLRGVASGRVSMRGPPGEAPLDVDVALDVANGTVAVTGRVDLTGAVPRYDLAGHVVGVRLAALVDRPVPPVSLTARFTVSGSGVAPESANARIAVDGRFTGWRTEATDTLRLRAQLGGGTLAIDTLVAGMGPGSLQASGRWDLRGGRALGIRYAIAFTDLGPFAPYLPALPDSGRVAGALRSDGRLLGTLARPQLQGTATGTALQVGEWTANDLRATYSYIAREATPNLTLTLEGAGVGTPTDVDFQELDLRVSLADRRFDIAFEGERTRGGTVQLSAQGLLRTEGANALFLRGLTLDVGEDTWALASPAELQWGASGVSIRGFRIRDTEGQGRVAIEGNIDFEGSSNLDATLTRLPLGDILPLVGVRRAVAGVLDARATVRGPASDPVITVELNASDAAVEGVKFAHVGGQLRYGSRAMRGRLLANLAGGGMLDVDASVPMIVALGRPPRFDVLDAEPLRVTIVADSTPLAPFGALSPLVRDMAGTVNGHIAIEGSVAEPRLAGSAELVNGAFTVPQMNQRYDRIAMSVSLEGRRLVLRSLEAASTGGPGWLRGEGTIEFAELTNPIADLSFRLDRFTPIGVEDMDDVQVSGSVDVDGPLFGRLVVTGGVRLQDGGVPLYSFGEQRELVGQLEELTASAGPVEESAGEPFMDRVVLDGLTVEVGDGVWFMTQQIRARLAGDLTVYRDYSGASEEMRIFGSLQGDQGTFTLQIGPIVRRFQIVEASVRFFGTPDPDPAISATASRVVIGPDGRRIEVLVQVEGTASAPRLALRTPDGTPIPESELLNVLVFGNQNPALGASASVFGSSAALPGTELVQDVLLGGVADVASARLEEAVINQLGLEVDFFQLRTPPGSFTTPQVVVGKELTDDVFLTVETGIATLFADWATTVEWQVDREWSLELAVRPLNERRFFLGVPVRTPFQNEEGRQISADIRRRWTY